MGSVSAHAKLLLGTKTAEEDGSFAGGVGFSEATWEGASQLQGREQAGIQLDRREESVQGESGYFFDLIGLT